MDLFGRTRKKKIVYGVTGKMELLGFSRKRMYLGVATKTELFGFSRKKMYMYWELLEKWIYWDLLEKKSCIGTCRKNGIIKI